MKKIYILDTNVLMYDPKALFAFDDNEVIIPLIVLDELDKHKTGNSQAAKHARMAIRSLDELRALGSIHEGVLTERGGSIKVELNHVNRVPGDLDPNRADNRLIGVALSIKEENESTGKKVTVITKDINLRVKCDALGMQAEDYTTDSVIESLDALYTGYSELCVESMDIDELYKNNNIPVKNTITSLMPNEYVHLKSNSNGQHSALAKFDGIGLRKINTYKNVWGIMSRNREQTFAFDALFDQSIKLVTITGRAGAGKAQPLDSKILTPNGWVEMKDVSVGDEVCTPDGSTAKILSVHPQGDIDIYKVIFSDGSMTKCCKEHLWYTKTQRDRDSRRSGSVKTLGEIHESLRYGKYNKRNHSIPITNPVYFNHKKTTIDPYIMGLLLGDGSFMGGSISFTNIDREIIDHMSDFLESMNLRMVKKSDGISYYLTKKLINGKKTGTNIKNKMTEEIKKLGLMGKKSNAKFVPSLYKYNDVDTRISLLRGIMDTDGTIGARGHISFTSVSETLANDVSEIVRSLGGTTRIIERITRYTYGGTKKDGQKSYRVNICMPNNIHIFSLYRKVSRIRERTKYFPRRYIDRVEYSGKEKAQCIYIDHKDHMYITDDFIVTHNTLLSAAAGVSQLLDHNIYNRLVLARPVMPLGKDIGYLPGDIMEKMDPWMAPLHDNLDLIFSDKGRHYLDGLFSSGVLEVQPLTYMRGRSMPQSFIIIDEAQNLSRHEVKTIITRVGDGSKVVLTGDIEQIDAPFIDSYDNGLSYVIEKFKDEALAAHITLIKGERSELATVAAEKL